MMYPLKFKPIYVEKPWGNKKLKEFRKDMPDRVMGESWDVACHPNGNSVITNGRFKGISLRQLMNDEKSLICGTSIDYNSFPLLIKILTVSEKLSVQVHPDDAYAQKMGEKYGKDELWYIMDAAEGAHVILGTRGCSKEEFVQATENNDTEKLLQRIPAKKGDVFHIKPGLIHTVDGEVIFAEIQQNSDITYRVYDYNRGRELHIDHAMNCIRFDLKGVKSPGVTIHYGGYTKTIYALSKRFVVELYTVWKDLNDISDMERFYIYTCVEGSGHITYQGGKVEINYGDSILIPASMGEYTISGSLKIIKSYVPNVEKIRRDILDIIE